MVDWEKLYLYENSNNPDFDKQTNMLDGHPVYAEHGEEGVIREVFNTIGTDSRFCVDIGAYDGYGRSNTRWLLDNGWKGLLLERRNWKGLALDVKDEEVTKENVIDLFEKYDLPQTINFLSIDIDGNDFWILKTILDSQYQPTLVCIEFNPYFEHHVGAVAPYAVKYKKNKTIFYGASLKAYEVLGRHYGYTLIHAMQTPANDCKRGRNAFLISSECISKDTEIDLTKLHPDGWKEPFKRENRGGKWRKRSTKWAKKHKEEDIIEFWGISPLEEFIEVNDESSLFNTD